jgi:hypothetical protein
MVLKDGAVIKNPTVYGAKSVPVLISAYIYRFDDSTSARWRDIQSIQLLEGFNGIKLAIFIVSSSNSIDFGNQSFG